MISIITNSLLIKTGGIQIENKIEKFHFISHSEIPFSNRRQFFAAFIRREVNAKSIPSRTRFVVFTVSKNDI